MIRELAALRRAVVTIQNNPLIIGGGVLLMLTKFIGVIFALSHPVFYIPGLLMSVLGSPYWVAGMYGLAKQARDNGVATKDAFIAAANNRFLTLFLGNAATVFIQLGVLSLVISIASFIGLSSLQLSTTDFQNFSLFVPSPEVIASVTTITALTLFTPLIPSFFLQFYDISIVAGSNPVREAFSESYDYVTHHLSGVYLYWLIRIVVTLAFTLPATVFRTVALAQIITSSMGIPGLEAYIPITSFTTIMLTTLLILSVLLGAVGEAIKRTYHVIYYKHVEPDDIGEDKL